MADDDSSRAPHPFEDGRYLQFSQALAHRAYPNDPRRTLEAHSHFRGPREYPLLFGEHGWGEPATGAAFTALWRDLEDGRVRAWARSGPEDRYEHVDPLVFHRAREAARLQMRAPQPPPRPGYIAIYAGPPLLGDAVDPALPEREAFIIFCVSETFLRDIVVSRADVLKHARTAPAATMTPADLGRLGGKKRRENLIKIGLWWHPRATELSATIDSNLSDADVANAIIDSWTSDGKERPRPPKGRTLEGFVASLRREKKIPQRSASLRRKK